MPTVYRIDGLRVVIYPDDHPPAHVHVHGGGREVIFDLNCPDGPLAERRSQGFTRRQANQIRAMLEDAARLLCERWKRIHG